MPSSGTLNTRQMYIMVNRDYIDENEIKIYIQLIWISLNETNQR